MSGIEWHASVADMLRNGRSIYPAPEMVTVAMGVLWVLAVLLFINILPGKFGGIVLLVLSATSIILVTVLLVVFHFWLPSAAALVGTLAVYPLQNWRRINEFIQSQFMIDTCLQSVFDSVQEGGITVDVKGDILYLNQESKRILGARSVLLIGKSLDQLLGVYLIPDKQDEDSNDSAPADMQSDCRTLYCMLHGLPGIIAPFA